MFEWKPPDPRLVALVRRLEAAVLRRFGSAPGRGVSTVTSEADLSRDEPADRSIRDVTAAPDGDPPTT